MMSDLVWDRTWHLLFEDILYRQHRMLEMLDLKLSDEQFKNFALVKIEKLLARNGSSLRHFSSLPFPDEALFMEGNNKFIREELRYDREKLLTKHTQLLSTMTQEQKSVFDEIMFVVRRNGGGVFFLYEYGGTGKTFIWRALASGLRSKCEIVIIVTSSGVEIVYASITSSYLWQYCKVLKLTKIMRLLQTPSKFATWLLRVGDGDLGEPNGEEETINIQFDLLVSATSVDPKSAIIEATYPDFRKNMCSKSYPFIFKTEGNIDTESNLYQTDYLNCIKCSGLPDHALKLKVGAPVILFQNIDQYVSLCNGTSLIIT
ncbi:hypothetical protein V2J09_013996 [Rumex salicifolius]